MTNKKFTILLLFMLLIVTMISGRSQTGMQIMVPAQTSLAGCTWNTAYVTVSNGLALCPLNLSGSPALAIAINGNSQFVQIPMNPPTAAVTSFNGRVGAITLTSSDITAAAPKVVTTVTSTAISSLQ